MNNKINLRTAVTASYSEIMTPVELFQNQILRPILKLQNDLCVTLFMHYAKRQTPDFETLSKGKKSDFIENSLQKDIGLKNNFIGIVVGMLTQDELEVYLSEMKEFNRRIITMMTKRLQSHIA